MVKSKKKNKKNLPEIKVPITRSRTQTITSSKAKEIVLIPARITRSKAENLKEKIQRQPVTVELKQLDLGKLKTVKAKEIVSIPARITRSRKVNSEEKIQQQSPIVALKTVKAKEIVSFPARITRSKIEKPKETIQQQARTVEPKTKRLAKCVSFVKVKTFEVNDIVLAKQKYSCPWPSQVLEIRKNTVWVYFFGDKRTGSVSSSELYDFLQSTDALKSTLAEKKTKNRIALITGVREVENLLHIPRAYSLVNTI